MPWSDTSGSDTNWASGYAYTTENLVTSTEAPPMYYSMDGDGNIRIIEEDIELEPTLDELVRDADWTI